MVGATPTGRTCGLPQQRATREREAGVRPGVVVRFRPGAPDVDAAIRETTILDLRKLASIPSPNGLTLAPALRIVYVLHYETWFAPVAPLLPYLSISDDGPIRCAIDRACRRESCFF